MPLYEFETPDGEVVTLTRPVERRDEAVVLKRRTVPSRVVVVTQPAAPITDMSSSVLNGYRKLEDQGKLKSSFTADQIKRAWAT